MVIFEMELIHQQVKKISYEKIILLSIFIFFSFVDLTSLIRVMNISFSSLFSFFILILIILYFFIRQKIYIQSIKKYFLLILVLIYGSIIAIQNHVWSHNFLQNLMIYLLFLFSSIFAFNYYRKNSVKFFSAINTGIIIATIITTSIVLVNIGLFGYGSKIIGATWIIGPRSVAIFSLIPLSWYISKWIYTKNNNNIFFATIWILIILSSLSRTATLSGFILLASGIFTFNKLNKKSYRNIIVSIFLFLFALTFVLTDNPLKQRFLNGDNAITVAGIPLNTSGRINLWMTLLDSITQKPYIGHGIGSSEVVILKYFNGLSHPHNDYLRLFHDLGLIGFLVFISQILIWIKFLKNTKQYNMYDNIIRYSSLLLLIGIGLMMFTDNPITYPFIMIPLGIILGGGLASAK